MRILYIHQYFNTPQTSGATRSYWISKELIRRGHQVIMITTARGAHSEASRKWVDGIDVVYVKNRYNNSMSPMRKVLSFANFVRLSILTASKEKDIDVVYATSTPLTVGIIALWLKRVKGWKFVFEVRDLWP